MFWVEPRFFKFWGFGPQFEVRFQNKLYIWVRGGMGNRVLVRTSGFDHVGPGAIFDFLGKTLENSFSCIQIDSFSIY